MSTIAQLAFSRTAFFVLMAFGPAASIGLNILDLLAGSMGLSTALAATFYAMLGIWILAMLTILLCLVCPPVGTYAADLIDRRNKFLTTAHTSTSDTHDPLFTYSPNLSTRGRSKHHGTGTSDKRQ